MPPSPVLVLSAGLDCIHRTISNHPGARPGRPLAPAPGHTPDASTRCHTTQRRGGHHPTRQHYRAPVPVAPPTPTHRPHAARLSVSSGTTRTTAKGTPHGHPTQHHHPRPHPHNNRPHQTTMLDLRQPNRLRPTTHRPTIIRRRPHRAARKRRTTHLKELRSRTPRLQQGKVRQAPHQHHQTQRQPRQTRQRMTPRGNTPRGTRSPLPSIGGCHTRG